MKQSNLIITLLGALLIVAFFVLMGDKFSDSKVAWLDGVVAVAAYVLIMLVNGRLFVSSEDFDQGSDVASLGVKSFFMWAYVFTAIPFMIIGVFVDIPFKWQLFVQLALAVVLLAGMLIGQGAANRLDEVERKSKARRQQQQQQA